MKMTPLRTAIQAREWLKEYGVSQCEFARRIGVHRLVVQQLLSSMHKGTWGDSHIAAVALGMKRDPSANPGELLPPMPAPSARRRRAVKKPKEATVPCSSNSPARPGGAF
jgi:gp16 family phage-associated protein